MPVGFLTEKQRRSYGRYHFTLNESVAEGGMSPLRDPTEIDEFEMPSQ